MKRNKLGAVISISFLLSFNLVAQESDSLDTFSHLASIEEDSLMNITSQNPAKTPNRSSPRATLVNFIENMNKSHRILMNANDENIVLPGFFIADEVKDAVYQANFFFKRAASCLDLSAFPPSIREDMGFGRAIMLKEILDRIALPLLEEIPDDETVDLEFESKKHPKLGYWRIPNSEIILVRTNAGILQGEYLFSVETIENLPTYYKELKHLPYKSEKYVSKGFYSFYISTPGLLMPPRWSHYLPEWSTKVYYSQTLWQWIALLISITITLVITKILQSLLIQDGHKFSPALKKWRKVMFYSLIIFITVFLNKILHEQINLSGETLIVTKTLLESLFWLFLSILSYNALTAIAEVIINEPKVTQIGIEATYTRATFIVIATFVSIVVIIFGLAEIGVSIIPLLTGVGIGGIAIALAARSTLENVIASFTIFADKPYRVNDRVKVMDYNGTIESIGVRATQIRLLSGPLVSVPNEKMASVEIENIQKRPFLRRDMDIRIKYGSSLEVIEKSVQIIKDILAVPEVFEDEYHPNMAINKEDYPPRIYFNKINADSLNIYVAYWYFPPEWWDFMKFSEKVNLEIIRKLNEASIEFAFPTQMLHLSEEIAPTTDKKNGRKKSK